MSEPRLENVAERAARLFDHLAKWLREGSILAGEFDAAGMPYPPQLQQLFKSSSDRAGSASDAASDDVDTRAGVAPSANKATAPVALAGETEPAPAAPDRPTWMTPDTMRLPMSLAIPQTATLALLRTSGAPVPVGDLRQKLRFHGFRLTEGVLANIGSRLDKAGLIRRDASGWQFVADAACAPMIHGRDLWGVASAFTSHEIASVRREEIVRLLAGKPGGVRFADVAIALKLRVKKGVPVSADLVKTDLQKLSEARRVQRDAQSGKWFATGETTGAVVSG